MRKLLGLLQLFRSQQNVQKSVRLELVLSHGGPQTVGGEWSMWTLRRQAGRHWEQATQGQCSVCPAAGGTSVVCGTECLTACGCARVCKSLVQQLRREFKENKVISWEIGADPLLTRLNDCFYIFTFCSQGL